MCGIVGHISRSSSNTVDTVMEGLRRLEYRGYDSAGVNLKCDSGEFLQFKRKGKLEKLKEVIESEKPRGHLAIGHTRWATHGKVNEVNAHPHSNDIFAIVHNGIIENAFELKSEIPNSIFQFQTETDTEVFLGLLTQEYADCKNVKKAIAKSFQRIEGNSAFVVVHKETDRIFAIKNSAPLVCGLKESTQGADYFVSSDPYALIGFAEKIYFPEDGVLCVLGDSSDEGISFYELDGTPSERYTVREEQADIEVSSKDGFEHFMLKEIHEQPKLINNFIQYYTHGKGKKYLDQLAAKQYDHYHIIGCGTAWHAGLLVKRFLEEFTGSRAQTDLASEFRYGDPILRSRDASIFISQSGETADTLACAHLCLEKNVETLSIVNVEGSTLYRDCNQNLLIKAGQEICVASTKAFTMQVLTGFLMSVVLGGKKASDFVSEFKILSHKIEELLKQSERIKEVAEKIYSQQGFIFTGREEYFPIALEGALKLKEIAYVHAEGYAAGELKHGPIALIDEKMVNIAIIGPELFEKTLSNAEEVKARRGQLIVLGQKGNPKLLEIADEFIELDFEGLTHFNSLYANVALQLLAYYIAKLKGTDIDKPRNLAKSVTVE